MASGSGKDQDDNQTKEPVLVLREESSAAATAAAGAEPPPPALPSERLQERAQGQPEAGDGNPSAATATAPAEPPAPPPPSERLQERAHGQPEAGDRKPSAAASATDAAAAVQRKSKGVVDPSATRAREPSSASGKPPLPPRLPRASKGKKPMSPAEVVQSGMIIRDKWNQEREDRIDLKETFDELMLEGRMTREMKEDEPEKDQVKSPTCPEKGYKKSHWRKFLDRIGIPDPYSRIMNPDVSYETIPMPNIITHYGLLEMVAGRGVEFHSNALNLRRTYSAFRPVCGDGECFYRSFIFSYLEQVLDRHDTHEEHRLLVAVEEVARQHEDLGWASNFSRSHKAFDKLIKKVMKWKKHGRWKHVSTTNRKEKLLWFFNRHRSRNDIYAFLRFVSAIWMCSHNENFESSIPELSNGCTLKDWCFREVIPLKVFTDHVPILALVMALGVPLRVEYLFRAAGEDLYTGQGSQDNMPGSSSRPSHPHQVPPDHRVPRVIVLYTQGHYDIMYPDPDAAVSQHSDEAESLTAGSPSQDQGGSCSGEKSGRQQIASVESPTGENSNQHTA